VPRADNLHVPIVLESGSLNLLEASGPVQACKGIALPFFLPNERRNMKVPVLNQKSAILNEGFRAFLSSFK
jgi:hypothetical protein